MKNTKKSKHLDIPAESNRDKHLNFLAQESGDTDPGADTFGSLFKKEDREQKHRSEEDEDGTTPSSNSY